MAKYRKKPTIIDAVVYKKGMEDGYVCYSIANGGRGIFLGYFEKSKPMPRTMKYPVIISNNIFHELNEGDYIITDKRGKKYPCKPDVFKQKYELIKSKKKYNDELILGESEYEYISEKYKNEKIST